MGVEKRRSVGFPSWLSRGPTRLLLPMLTRSPPPAVFKGPKSFLVSIRQHQVHTTGSQELNVPGTRLRPWTQANRAPTKEWVLGNQPLRSLASSLHPQTPPQIFILVKSG